MDRAAFNSVCVKREQICVRPKDGEYFSWGTKLALRYFIAAVAWGVLGKEMRIKLLVVSLIC